MLLLEYDKENPEELSDIVENYKLVNAGKFDVAILASSRKPVLYKNGIHVWIKTLDEENANLMIILSYILLGHPDWSKSDIKIFDVCKKSEEASVKARMNELIEKGRLPITPQSVKIIIEEEGVSYKTLINKYSTDAGLTIIGFIGENIKHPEDQTFNGYDNLGNILFVNSYEIKHI